MLLGFHVLYLPWLDDARQVPIVRLKEDISTQAVDSAKNLINKLKLKQFVPVENCAIQSVHSMVEAYALHRDTLTR